MNCKRPVLVASMIGVTLGGAATALPLPDGDWSGGTAEAAAVTTSAATSVVLPVTTTTVPASSQAPPTTVAGVATQLIGALGPTLGDTIGVDDFVDPDEACLEAAIETLEPSVRESVGQLVDDPSLFHSLDDAVVEAITLTYLGCIDADTLPGVLAAVTTRAVDQLPCLADVWAELVTPQRIASSMAYGTGLDDLPVEIVDQLTLTAAACVPDPQWWIDDEALFLQQQRGWDADQAGCVASSIVDAFGVGPIIERRVLTLGFYPLPLSELDGTGVAARCGVTLPEGGALDAPPGSCLAGFGGGSATTERIGCDQAHNAEVVTVTDLTAEFSTWPGYQDLTQTVIDRCVADVQALSGDLTGYGVGWDIANRLAWEVGEHMLTCVLIRPDFADWTGPSGLIPITESESSPPATMVYDLTSEPTCTIGQTLSRGSAGPQVQCLQQRLNEVTIGGTPVPEDGRYGDETEVAVRAFQQANGLTADGAVGPITGGALGIWPV
jgi:hypothetical protein